MNLKENLDNQLSRWSHVMDKPVNGEEKQFLEEVVVYFTRGFAELMCKKATLSLPRLELADAITKLIWNSFRAVRQRTNWKGHSKVETQFMRVAEAAVAWRVLRDQNENRV